MDSDSFRKPLIEALRAAKVQRPGAVLHLLYSPELADPLTLIDDLRRDTAVIRPPSRARHVIAPQKQNFPRLITLDCLRVAKYLLETDAGLDDPLLEASITQAHAEMVLQQHPDAVLENDDRSFTELAIGGWLVSCEPASTIASRLQQFSPLHSAQQRIEWVRWTNPVYIRALWPILTAEQKHVLLGEAIWFVFDVSGQLRCYAADDQIASASASGLDTASFTSRSMDPQQTQIVRNMPLVRDLLTRWRAMREKVGQRLPDDAEHQLHVHVQAGRVFELDADSLAIYVLTAVQLKPAATQDAEWVKLMHNTRSNGLALRDQIGHLSDDFWNRWSDFGHGQDDSGAMAMDEMNHRKKTS